MHLHGPISGALHLERGASISPFFLSPDSVPGEIGAFKEGVQVERLGCIVVNQLICLYEELAICFGCW